MKITVACIIFLMSFPFCARSIEGEHILKVVDSFLGDMSFEEALKCSDEVNYVEKQCKLTCNDSGCVGGCENPFKGSKRVIECGENDVSWMHIDPTNSKKVTITDKLYTSIKGNYLRYLIETRPSVDFIYNSYRYSEFKYKGRIVKTIIVNFTYITCYNVCYYLNFDMTFGKDISFMAQPLEIVAFPKYIDEFMYKVVD